VNRRAFVTGLGAVLATLLAPEARAQQAKVARLGFLGFGTPDTTAASRIEALRAGLRDLGYVEGKNLVIEFRWSGTVAQMQEAAAELARMNVDIIFASSSTEVEPARGATKTIPIVFAVHADPVGIGHVSSLARPGGPRNPESLGDCSSSCLATILLTASLQRRRSPSHGLSRSSGSSASTACSGRHLALR